MNQFNLQPLPLRDEAQPGYEKAAWKPNWKCFCCHDNGIIPERIVKTVIPNYVTGRHKPVKCNNCNIRLADTLYDTNTLDLRFPQALCVRFAHQEKIMWQQWCIERHEYRKLKIASATKNLRTRERTTSEQLDAERRHQDMTTGF